MWMFRGDDYYLVSSKTLRIHAAGRRVADQPRRHGRHGLIRGWQDCAGHWLRVAGALLTLFGVAVVVFLVLRVIPGDAITASLGHRVRHPAPTPRRGAPSSTTTASTSR